MTPTLIGFLIGYIFGFMIGAIATMKFARLTRSSDVLIGEYLTDMSTAFRAID